ncbi:MAG: hypothetical protein ACRDSS_05260 [Actinocrinis sp.]
MDLWSIEQVRAYLGAASTGSARRTLSNWGVAAVTYGRSPSGRAQAMFDSEQVEAAKQGRPGRGARTDKRAYRAAHEAPPDPAQR